MIRKLQSGYVFDVADEEKVMGMESDEAAMLRAAKHVRDCCGKGHSCKNGDRCREKCESCHRDAMAVWDGKKYGLDRQADAFLARADGIPCLAEEKVDLPSVEDMVGAVLDALSKAGIIF